MRKIARISLAFTLLCILLCGCQPKEKLTLPFLSSEIETVEVYHFESVPADSEKKTITETADIQKIYDTLTSIRVEENKLEPSGGGAMLSFRFHLNDQTSYEVIYCSYAITSGTLNAKQFNYQTSADITPLWDKLSGQAVTVEEIELP